MVSSITMSIFVFIDSYSLIKWEEDVGVGPCSMVVNGGNIPQKINDLMDLDGVTKAAVLSGAFLNVESYFKLLNWNKGLDGVFYSERFADSFPSIYSLIDGRFPENVNEVAMSVMGASLMKVQVGSSLNYSQDFTIVKTPATVVGIYEFGEKERPNQWIYTAGDIMVHEGSASQYKFNLVYIDIDRSGISAHDPAASMRYLLGIEEEIHRLDPLYDYMGASGYAVFNSIALGIEDYDSYLSNLRVSQLVRSAGVFLLGFLIVYMAVIHVVNEKDFESNILVARGASKRQTRLIISREILVSTLIALPLGIILGITASRIGLSAVGFFVFDWNRFFSEPLLVTVDAIIFSTVAGFLSPLLIIFASGGTKREQQTSRLVLGRLGRITKVLDFLGADALVLSFSLLFLLTLNLGSDSVRMNPVFSIVIALLPYVIFFSLTKISLSGFRKVNNGVSRVFSRMSGKIPSSIGVRRLGKETSSSVILVLVLVLAMSLGWNYTIADATLPITKENQTKFAIGGDVAFHLDPYESDLWNTLIETIEVQAPTSQGSLLMEFPLPLSSGSEGLYDFVSIDPHEYINVGYDSLGNPLNASKLSAFLLQLQVEESGAIITSDIAQSYGLTQGGLLRAFWYNETTLESLEFQIIGIVDAIPDTLTFTTSNVPSPTLNWKHDVGAGRIWINNDYIEGLRDSFEEVSYVYCVRLAESTNATHLIEDILTQECSQAILNNEWASVTIEVENYTGQESYILDRAADSLSTLLSVAVMFGAFSLYSIEGLRSRRREIALLKSLGSGQSTILLTQASEMSVLYLISIFLLLVFAPILTTNNLLSTMIVHDAGIFVFPNPFTLEIPWLMLSSILGFFIICVAVFIAIVSILGASLSLSETLNYAWTESGPYKEES
jgi:hypothetical protein